MYTTGAMVKLVTTVLEISWRAWSNGSWEDDLQSEIGIVPWSNQWMASHVVWLLLLLYMYIVLIIFILIGWQPRANFGNQLNLQISQLSASRQLTNM